MGGWLVTLQSLLTIKKGSNPFNFQSNETKNDNLKISIRFISGKYDRGGGGSDTWLLWILKRALELLNYQFNEPPQKFIWSAFLYIHFMVCPCPMDYCRGEGEFVIQRDIVSGAFQLRWTKWLSQKLWLDVFGDTVGAGGWLFAFQSLSTVKKGSSPFTF